MKFKALSLILVLLAVFTVAMPALASWGEIASAVEDGVRENGVIENGINTLKGEITSAAPGVSGWLETIITFLTTYLGDVFSWLP